MADYLYINETGTIVPDTSAILAEVQDDYKAVFGADLVTDASTPQGVLITAEALARTEVVNNNAALANQINPNIAGGVFLDAIMALLGLQRIAATRSVVPSVLLTGVAGTVIPAGSQAENTSGSIFQSQNTVVIGVDGTITTDFVSVDIGPVVCNSNTLNKIQSNVLGWETINNPTAAIVGINTMSDQAARAYRNNILAFQAVSLAEAITSALYHVEGVSSLSFLENTAATTQTIEGISMIAHSVWACVRGGSDVDVAAALLENKSSGAGWNGGTTVNVVEPSSGQTYAVKFDRPTEVPILVRVTSPNGISQNIITAILQFAAGTIGGLDGFTVGYDISPFEIAAAINFLYPETFISKVEITLASAPSGWSTDTLAIAVDEVATTQESYITVITS
jgi:hypothetical protein